MSASEKTPIVKQPAGQIVWMPLPELASGIRCPPGLEYLTMIDQILIHQQIEIFEALTNIDMVNRYAIKNTLGQQIYFAREVSSFCHRVCCKAYRGFYMPVMDNHGTEVMRIVRPFKCCSGCCWCADNDHCAFELQVEAPPGNVVGSVRQRYSKWKAIYDVLDSYGDVVFKLEQDPCCSCQCVCGCTKDIDFNIYSATDGSQVGMIFKQWAGFLQETFTKAHNFGVKFPMDLDVQMKATLIGLVIMIDFAVFEMQKDGNNQY